MPRKVLIIASDFPPLAGTNTQRVQSFVRHLPRFGWQPVVITRSIEDMPLIDSAQLGRLDAGLAIHRLADPDVFAWLRRRRGATAQDIQRSPGSPEQSAAACPPENTGARSNGALRASLRLASSVVMTYRRKHSYLPDALAPWASRCVAQGKLICRAENISAILASAPSYSCLVAGLRLAKRSGLPFVADFRDLWVDRPYRQVASRKHDARDRQLEREVVLGAQRIILASPAWIEHFRQTYGEAVAMKCVVITNGYDETLIPAREDIPSSDSGVTTFLNTGAMYGAESPAPFLSALGNLLQRRPELRSKVRVRLIGYAGDEEANLRQLIARHQLDRLVSLSGPQAHEACLKAQLAADVLLLFSGGEHVGTLRGKSFEYLSTGKPILALIPEQGTQAELLRRAGSALIVQHGDVEKTECGIEELLRGAHATTFAPDWGYIRQFERNALTGALAKTLDDLAPTPPMTASVS